MRAGEPSVAGLAVAPRVLHAIVGHKLPIYFLNAVRSVRLGAPDEDLLVVDNASELPELRAELERLAATDPRIRLKQRSTNDLRNTKVGGLYDAYRDIVAHAIDGGYDLLHLIQGDMQMLWWDRSIVEMADELFGRFPTCVNIQTIALPRDQRLTGSLREHPGPVRELTGFGLTDTGLYHLARWQAWGVQFGNSEQEHARVCQARGMRVLCHPWACVAPIPWPPVVRHGVVRGREVTPPRALVLRPFSAAQASELRQYGRAVWLEDVCVPWGWTCLTPLWPTALESIDYWVFRYRDARERGWRAARPRWDRRGLECPGDVRRVQRRPRIWELVVLPAWHAARKQLAALRSHRAHE